MINMINKVGLSFFLLFVLAVFLKHKHVKARGRSMQ